MVRLIAVSGLLCGAVAVSACSRGVEAISPEQLQQQYGITDARRATENGVRGTIVPVTLRDGTKAELLIPDQQPDEPHQLYLHDGEGFHPVDLQDNVRRDQVVEQPTIVTRRPEQPHPRRRSWEKDVVIIGGGAGAGAAVGALTGGKKGAGIGAGAGGLGGLIYDLATRHR